MKGHPFPDIEGLIAMCEVYGRTKVSEITGVSPSSLHRALHGWPLDADNLAALGRLLDMPMNVSLGVDRIPVKEDPLSGEALLDRIEELCRNDPDIPDERIPGFMRMFRTAYREFLFIMLKSL